MQIKSEIEKTRDALQQQRDELRVQLNLAKLEAKDEWESAERQFHALEGKLKEITVDASDASKDVLASAKHLVDDIQVAYHRIRRHL